RRLGVEDNFLLFVGTVEPRKNLMTLVRALDEILRTTDLRPQLVIAGKEGWLTGELLSYVRSAGMNDRVRFTGYVSDDDLRALYSTCQVMVYPSLYEGFGLPPLEAMACGAPVIASRDKSVMETMGTAARLVEATDVPRLAENIVELLRDEGARSSLAAAGRKRAAQFTWKRTARATLEVYREALARKRGKGGA
ncbi:MAG: glycosyltransferase family 4 protein, partial [Acidobacteriota bacterium]|nr:glycosyltransferase family 4 protein [Acidobacteriota bacterium]